MFKKNKQQEKKKTYYQPKKRMTIKIKQQHTKK
jgi:hypothetical protein